MDVVRVPEGNAVVTLCCVFAASDNAKQAVALVGLHVLYLIQFDSESQL